MESDTFRFISLIEKHPQLYNKKHKDFLRQDIRNTIWESICKEMNWDGKSYTNTIFDFDDFNESHELIELFNFFYLQTPTKQRKNGVIFAINS